MYVKVGDLLQEPGTTDELSFDSVEIPQLSTLTNKGVSGTLQLQSVSKDNIFAKFSNIVAYVNDISDISAQEFVRKVSIDTYEVKYMVGASGEDGEIFPIDPKTMTIDLSEPLRQAILLQEPFVHKMEGE